MKTPTNTNRALGERMRSEPPKPIVPGHHYDAWRIGGSQGQVVGKAFNLNHIQMQSYINDALASSERVSYRDINERLCKGIHPE